MKKDHHEVRLDDLSKLQYSFSLVSMPSSAVRVKRGLVISFSGQYSEGAAGDDGAFMAAIAAAGIEAWQPDGIVFDLQKLSYQWGDRIQIVLQIGYDRKNTLEKFMMGQESELKTEHIKTVIVTSELCQNGLESLVRNEMRLNPREWIFPTMEAALEALLSDSSS